VNPVLPLPLLLPLLALVLGAAIWLSWRATRGLPVRSALALLTLRSLALAALAALLLNPGRWVKPTEDREKPWLVLVDHSASMAQPLEKSTRHQTATKIADQITKLAPAEVPVRVRSFALTPAPETDSLPGPDAPGTDLSASLKSFIDEASASGDRFSGIVVLSDGRQTIDAKPTDLEALALRLRAARTPVHAIALGAGENLPDLLLRAPRPTLTTFSGQTVKIPVMIESQGMDPIKPEVRLLDPEGRELGKISVELKSGTPAFLSFEIPAPAASQRLTLETPALPGEARPGNNRAQVQIRLLETRTRIFLAEGAPYWDSKFLAQLLRQQSQMEVHSVHRLSEDRFFRIDTGQSDATESASAIFPETLEELSSYDLIVFGKNVDSFLTPARLEALRAYVRDRGGAVLFARGKPTTSALPALETLEPVSWAGPGATEFRFVPTVDGAAAGLFGDALPPPDASVWTQLPTLKDSRQIASVKPFTRVLALANDSANTGFASETPALLVRRYGQGVCGLVNGDGLWRWDFFPEARELGNMYEDFWTQLIQWMASYSEFLPGQEFSLRLSAPRSRSGEPLALTLSYRGQDPDPAPGIEITAPDGSTSRLQPAKIADPGGQPAWRASLTPDATGTWSIRVVDPREKAPPTPQADYLIPTPPRETDDLSADPAFLESLTTATGGRLHETSDFARTLIPLLLPEPPSATSGNAVWKSSWAIWPVATFIALLFSTEWYLRRRQGLP
jgi:hypothetical protein